MFAKPRPKKSVLPPPSKKRKYGVEEVSFDFDARQEYLTGFHKRKQQRIKLAQEEAAKRAREERLRTRKQIRDERKREVEEHVEHVNKLLRESGAIEVDSADEQSGSGEEANEGEWTGFPDRPNLDIVDHEEEYIDEDRYTTVTVESVSISRDGLERPEKPQEQTEGGQEQETEKADQDKPKAKEWPKKKKQKFRYESKFDRQLTERRQKAKSKAKSKARRSE
ncbi:nucleolar protein 12 domain-containing protein [Trichoderma afarasin]|uniref:Nucleolar protein 12 (25kDa) domain-containing protein n=1 Tax=Trichoderma breve TaxID=2034170 RepID=A0A9W9E4J7_9HYPO|nr:nucleolar protein 12 (25kDa) domain-containing protein [Trichoderma breve]KAJ4856357.1 nucleolar protein 12 (25kDa) domain-containing protein [Trichoderma breve]